MKEKTNRLSVLKIDGMRKAPLWFCIGIATVLLAAVLMYCGLSSFGLHLLLVFMGAGCIDHALKKGA